MKSPTFIIVDLFCGAGGTTTGFVMAGGLAKVIACVNHDPIAIKSHWANHPEVMHFEEDIRTLDLTELTEIVKINRNQYPDAYLILWASLECTNFSKAKGGQPRDADSRTLADHLLRYITAIDPDYVQIENVVEFMSWGPLDENGKPVSRKNGRDFMRWCKEIDNMGFRNEWQELNSANFGAYTSRNRLFGVFAKHGLPVGWPEATHAKVPSKAGMYGDLRKWMPVKDVLDFSDEGESIFNRKKDLSDKTLDRIYAGLIKYVAQGDTSFISKYYSGKPAGKVIPTTGPAGTIRCSDGQALVQADAFISNYKSGHPSSKNTSVESPCGTLTTSPTQALVQPEFLLKYNSMDKNGKHTPPSIEEPAPVVSCQGRMGLVQPQFLAAHYSNGANVSSVESPCPTISTKDRFQFVQPEYLVQFNKNSSCRDISEPSPALMTKDKLGLVQPKYAQNQSIDQPAGTIMATDKHRLVEAVPFIMPTNFDNGPKSIEDPSPVITADRHHTYIVNPSHGGHSTSTDAPCPVIIARQDKAPLYLVQVENGPVRVPVYDTDSEICIKIKHFMAVFGLGDIKMRMLRVPELLKIQGFPEGYKLEGNQADQKKFIGNSVVPHVVKHWTIAMANKINSTLHLKTA